MRRVATLFTFVLFAGPSALALADEPPVEQEKKADEKKADEKKADDKKSGGCSVTDNSDAIVSVAGLALLLSGVALRRRS